MNNILWQEKINIFLDDKCEADFSKYLKEIFKNLGQQYEKENFFYNDDLQLMFSRRNRRADDQKETEFIFEQLQILSKIAEQPKDLDFDEIMKEVLVKKNELLDKYSPNNWITWAAENARSVTFATHVSKLTHSSINSTSFFDSQQSKRNSYLTSSNLNNVIIDGAVSGNQFAPIYQFLELSLNNKKLVSHFNDIDTNLLSIFSKDEEQMKKWNAGFFAALNEGNPSAHFLLKQVYFPIETNQYHLLCNVVSSSKAHAIFEFTRQNTKELFNIKIKNKYSDKIYFNFFNRASIAITASNHGNASQLNGSRGGRLNLFSCNPPIWHSQIKPPIYKTSFFYELSKNREITETVQFLADFLARFESLQLSIKDPKRLKWIEDWLENITDEIMVYVKTIQNLSVGWSATQGIRLKIEHQVLLDCHRQDNAFKEIQHSVDWQTTVIKDFAAWLNVQLHKANQKFTPQDSHTKLWSKLFENNLREFFDMECVSQQENVE